jgi:sugar O-acyltransferase (sialic acid O-acetyltransferase NeuD family)
MSDASEFWADPVSLGDTGSTRNAGSRRPVVIVGAGGLGREALAAARAGGIWDVKGFVDDRADLPGTTIDGVPVLGSLDLLTDGSVRDHHALVCTGRPGNTTSRARIDERLSAAGVPFASVVHPSASLAAGTRLGPGAVVLAQVVTTTPITIGRHVVIMPQVVFTHDDVIGDYTTFGAGARLAGGVVVGDGAYIGSGALIREYVTVGAGALVGMGAVVTRDVPPGEVWVGNPARPLDRSGLRGPNAGSGDPTAVSDVLEEKVT